MSGDVALLETLAEEWSRGEFWHGSAYADDVVFVVSGPDAAEYHGIAELTTAWRSFLSAWDDFRMEHEGIVPGKDGAFVILMRNLGRGRESGVDIDASVASLVHVHDGRIDRMEMFWDREAALAAAGVQGAT